MALLVGLIGIVVVLLVIGTVYPILWPMVTGTVTENITAMTGTDAGTTTFQAFWPVVLLVVGIGLAVGLVVYGLRKFGLMGGSSLG